MIPFVITASYRASRVNNIVIDRTTASMNFEVNVLFSHRFVPTSMTWNFH